MKYGREIWLVAAVHAIGGAETRMIKIANKMASEEWIETIHLLITQQLFEAYQKHVHLSHLIKDPKFRFIIADERYSRMYYRIYKKFFRGKFTNRFIEAFFLKKRSWYSILKKQCKSADIIHCYMGDEARNGLFLLSMEEPEEAKPAKIILEITSNRLTEQTAENFQLLSDGNVIKHKNLVIRSVSKRVYKNWNSNFSDDWFQVRNIDNDYYRGPFIEMGTTEKADRKEKIILFPHRFIVEKNVLLFSEVISKLYKQDKLHGWKVQFRGQGPMEPRMRELLQKWIDGGEVDISYSQDLYVEMKKAAIVVSLIETGSYPSQSIFEAMNHGCALILGDTGNTREEFEHPDITFCTLEREDIAEKLLTLTGLSIEELRKRGKKMESYFNWFLDNRNQSEEVKNLYLR